jgi:hypothetical protein
VVTRIRAGARRLQRRPAPAPANQPAEGDQAGLVSTPRVSPRRHLAERFEDEAAADCKVGQS